MKNIIDVSSIREACIGRRLIEEVYSRPQREGACWRRCREEERFEEGERTGYLS